MKKGVLIFIICMLTLVTLVHTISAGAWYDNNFNTNLKAYYNFSEGSGTATQDIFSYNHNGTLINSPNWKTGISGSSVNGTHVTSGGGGSYINLSSPETLINISQPFSLSAWVYFDVISADSGSTELLSTVTNLTNDANPKLQFDFNPNKIRMAIKNSSGDGFEFYADLALTTGKWYNLICSYSGLGNPNQSTIYIDGVNITKTAITGSFTPDGSTFANTHLMGGGGYYTLGGRVDEVAIWNKVINSTEAVILNSSTFYELLTTPVVTIIYPTNTTYINFQSNLNYTVSHTSSLDSCWYSTNNGVTNSTPVSAGVNFTGLTSILGSNSWKVYCNDTTNFLGEKNVEFSIVDVKENSQTYQTPTTSGTSETFSINISYNSTRFANAQMILVYNNTRYTGTIYGSGGEITSNKTLVAPTVTTPTNVPFYWEIGLNNGSWNYYNSTNYTQTVNAFGIDDCTLNSITLYNFTIYDEKTQGLLVGTSQNTTANLDLDVYSSNGITLIGSYSQNYTKTNPFRVCVNSSLNASESYLIDLQLQYFADGYSQEYYHIQKGTVDGDNLYQNISLYDLDNQTTQKFVITYKDSNLLPVSDALIQIQRKYVNEGVFKVVEIPKTDFNGETLASLEPENAIYTFVVTKDGETLATFNEMEAVCQNPALSECKINLNSFSTSVNTKDFTVLNDFAFIFTYNRTTRTVQGVYTVPSGSSATVVLNVTMFDSLGTTEACSDSLTSASGTLSCVIPNSFGNGTAIATITKNGELVSKAVIDLRQKPSEVFGFSLIFLSIFMFLTLIGIGIGDNPMTTGFFLILGAIIGVALNLIGTGSSSFIGAGATVLWIIIAIIIIIMKGANR